MERMVDKIISTKLDIKSTKLEFHYNMFNQLVHGDQILDHKLTIDDKINLKKILEQVNDNLHYDYPAQKLQIYTIIMFSNFIGEGIYLDLDPDYVNSIINVVLNTNIVHVLFTIL